MNRLHLSIPTIALFLLASLSACSAGSGDGHSGHGENDEHGEHGEGAEHGDHGEDGEHGEHDEEVVRLTEEAVRRSRIRLAPVVVGTSGSTFEIPAEVQFNPNRVAHVAPLVAGQILEVRAELGDHVEAGQVLAVIRSVDLGRARAEYRRAQAMLEVAKANYARQERLRKEGISSERAYLEAQMRLSEAQAEYDAALAHLSVYGVRGGTGPDVQLKAPLSGVVIERHATRGENVGPEDTLFVVADTSEVWVIGRVYEQHLKHVVTGMRALLTLRAYPSRTWEGTVTYVSSRLDEETRSVTVRVELDNPDGSLKPGLFGTLRIQPPEDAQEPVLLVPESAVQRLRGRTVVFVPDEQPHTFRAVPVVTGHPSGSLVEILEGLPPDARVVVEGAFVLKSQLMRSELGEGHAH